MPSRRPQVSLPASATVGPKVAFPRSVDGCTTPPLVGPLGLEVNGPTSRGGETISVRLEDQLGAEKFLFTLTEFPVGPLRVGIKRAVQPKARQKVELVPH